MRTCTAGWMMVLAILAFPALWFQPARAERAGDGGDAACPCLTASQLPARSNDTNCSAGTRHVLVPYEGLTSGYCYPAGYGLGSCRYWDDGLPPTCTSEQHPGWCVNQWCFVNPFQCELAHKPSYYLPGLHYSYATCGGAAAYDQWLISQGLDQKKIRFHVDSWSTMAYRDPISHEWRGYVWDVWQTMAARAGFILEEVPVLSSVSTAKFSSTFTQCAYDVALGHVDTCLPAIWETLERREFVNCLTPIRHDQVKTVVKRTSDSWWSMSTLVYKPFTPALWAFIFLVLSLTAVAYYMLEKDANEHDYPGIDFSFQDPERCKLRYLVNGVCEAFYQGLLSFALAGPVGTPVTTPGSILNIGMAWFILITISVYTGKLASQMTVTSINTASSLNDIIRLEQKVCILDAIDEMVGNVHPILTSKNLIVTCGRPDSPASCRNAWSDMSELLDALDAGDCDAVINSEEALHAAMVNEKHCDKSLLPETVLVIIESHPIRTDDDVLNRGLSYHIARMRTEGDVANIQSMYRKTSPCLPGHHASSTSLGLDSLAGAFSWLLLAFGLAMFMWYYECKYPERRSLRRSNAGRPSYDLPREEHARCQEVVSVCEEVVAAVTAQRSQRHAGCQEAVSACEAAATDVDSADVQPRTVTSAGTASVAL